jgi:hypothetical protein
MSFVVRTNDHRSWTLYGVSTKKNCSRQTLRRHGTTPYSVTKIMPHNGLKNKPIRLHLLIYSISWALHPQGTGTLALGCSVAFAHGVALLCFV